MMLKKVLLSMTICSSLVGANAFASGKPFDDEAEKRVYSFLKDKMEKDNGKIADITQMENENKARIAQVKIVAGPSFDWVNKRQKFCEGVNNWVDPKGFDVPKSILEDVKNLAANNNHSGLLWLYSLFGKRPLNNDYKLPDHQKLPMENLFKIADSDVGQERFTGGKAFLDFARVGENVDWSMVYFTRKPVTFQDAVYDYNMIYTLQF